jgi:uncharacterized membrane protein YozB (DUF420 family)
MDGRLRVMVLATALLVVPQIGQFAAIRDINLNGHESNLTLLFMVAAIFLVPTSLILTIAIAATVRKSWREHQNLLILGAVNLVLCLSITWFFFSQCGWATVFGIALRSCH